MKFKNLVPLLVILAVLVALGVLKKAKDRPVTIQEQVKLTALLPEGLSKADVAKLELYAGGKPDDKLTLFLDSTADKWRVASHFYAPVKKTTMDEYLDALVKLKGEFRSQAAQDSDLEQYNLTDQKAFHVAGYKKDSAEPSFRVLFGKSPDYRTVFARAADAKDVYVIDENLRSKAGLYGEETDKAPTADTWLEKEVVKLNKDKITKIESTSPDKHFVFEKRQKPVEEPAKPETPASEPAADASNPDATKPEETPAEPKVEYEWALATGGPGIPHKQTGLDSFLRSFDGLMASDVVDPAKKADWGLETPAFKSVISVEGQAEPVVLEGGRPDPAGDGYVRLASAKDDIVYKISKYTFERMYPKGTELFDLPGLTADKTKIERIELTQPEGRVVLEKTDNQWKVTEPAADLEYQTSTQDNIASALTSWKPADYADSTAGTGLDTPVRTATFALGGGESHTISLGTKSQNTDGAYAKLDGGKSVLVMSKTDMDRIFVTPKNLYELTLLDIVDDDVNELRIERANDAFKLARQDESWMLTVGEATIEADKDKAEDLLSAFSGLQAKDILFGQAAMQGDMMATVRAVMKDGKEHAFIVGTEQDSVHQLQMSDKKQVFTASHADVEELLPTSDSLKKSEPAPAPTEPEEGAAPSAPGKVTHPEAAAPPEATIPTAPATGEATPTPATPVTIEPAPKQESPAVVIPAPAAPSAEISTPSVPPAAASQAPANAPAPSEPPPSTALPQPTPAPVAQPQN
ncbi:MAG: DUF4340 domain-containing protein [Candidatus Hydrogenedentes bacterium]|nr:DUF4340 domain-containing protein [Candidatus Hydrogenedentota bacterium]